MVHALCPLRHLVQSYYSWGIHRLHMAKELTHVGGLHITFSVTQWPTDAITEGRKRETNSLFMRKRDDVYFTLLARCEQSRLPPNWSK